MNEIQNINSQNVYNGQGLIKQMNKSLKQDTKLFQKIGNNLENTKADYFNALASGDQTAIAKAQDKYQNLQLAMRAAIEFISNKFRVMMDIISRLNIR